MSAERFNDRVKQLVQIRAILRGIDCAERTETWLDSDARLHGEITTNPGQVDRVQQTLSDCDLALRSSRDQIPLTDGGKSIDDRVAIRFADTEANAGIRVEMEPRSESELF